MRLALALATAAIVTALCLFAQPVSAQDAAVGWTVEDIFNALDAASASTGVSWRRLYSIVRCETWPPFNPYSRGRQGELGPVQLHPRGELPRFRSWGYTDPFNPYEAIEFLALRLQQGGARAWSCA